MAMAAPQDMGHCWSSTSANRMKNVNYCELAALGASLDETSLFGVLKLIDDYKNNFHGSKQSFNMRKIVGCQTKNAHISK